MEYEMKDTDNVLHRSKRNNIILNKELEYWMTQLPEVLKNVPIIHLAIPGKFQNIFLFYQKLYPQVRYIFI